MADNTTDNIVYLVNVFHGGVFLKHGIFSNYGNAAEWMNSFSKDHGCLCAPFKVDDPSYGVREVMQ